ncbi:MAG: PadR family transcriptional regulator [Campylobacteraceae bacterium]|nr:PadR family transcriptional regulator [Campylobacteraceae bacterium]
MQDDYKKWLTQFRKGYVELYTLLSLKKNSPMHGLAILRFFEKHNLSINEGTLYPLLNRMETNGWLSSSWNVPKISGHPKREYTISKKGEEILPLLLLAYEEHHKSINQIMKEK